MTEHVPAGLEAAIKADLHPVRPFAPPGRRVLWLLPVAFVTLVAASRIFSLRGDAPVLGWTLTWGTSLLETIVALMLVALALRNSIPGRSLRASALTLAMGGVLGLSTIVTLRTWNVSPTTLAPYSPVVIGEICFVGTILTSLPLLVGAAVLASRAFSVRPWSSGALYGLGAGLGADAGWRLFCHYSDPTHVFPTHTGAVFAVALLGMLVSGVAQRFSARSVSTRGRSGRNRP